MYKSLASLSLLFFLCSCESKINVRGNLLTDTDMRQIKIGETTQQDLETILGPPTYVEEFGGKGWYYIGEETNTTSFFHPTLEERKIIYFSFDATGRVQRIKINDETDALDVKIEEDKTPTLGRDPALFQEIFGSIGKYDEGKHKAGYV